MTFSFVTTLHGFKGVATCHLLRATCPGHSTSSGLLTSLLLSLCPSCSFTALAAAGALPSFLGPLFLPRPCHLYVSREGSDSPMWVFRASEPPLVCGCLAPGPLGTDTAVSAGGAPAVGQTGGCGAAPPMEALPPSSPVSGLWIPPQVLSPRTQAHGTRRGPAGHTPTAGGSSNRDGPAGRIRSRPSLRARPAPFTEPLPCARPPSGPFLFLCPLETLFSQIVLSAVTPSN